MNQEPNRPKEATVSEQETATGADVSRGDTARLKRRIIIAMIGMVVLAVLCFAIMGALEQLEAAGDEAVTMGKPNTVIYVDPDYEYDIMKDSEYLGLDRHIYYCDETTGMTVMLDEQTMDDHGPAILVLKAMVDAIIAGDADAYNALFSENYFATDGNAPEESFTMQQVYDILFTKVQTSEQQTEAGKRYTQYEVTVEYKIHKNNGTFRTDLGHDDSRKQYFVLSDSTGSAVLIDQILNYQYQ